LLPAKEKADRCLDPLYPYRVRFPARAGLKRMFVRVAAIHSEVYDSLAGAG